MKPSRDLQERLYRELMDDDALARQKREAATKCKTCGSPITWAVYLGNHVPLEYDPHEGGTWFYYADAGTCFRGKQEDPTPPGATRHYRHDAVCRGARPVQETI